MRLTVKKVRLLIKCAKKILFLSLKAYKKTISIELTVNILVIYTKRNKSKAGDYLKYYIGIDIGGTNIKYGLLNEEGLILDQGKVKTARNDGDDIIVKIQEVVTKYEADYEIKAVGVSAPGSIRDDGFMITGGAIKDFYGINLKEILEDKIGLSVFLENDANCAALAELWLGSGKEKKHFLFAGIGTAVGGAIVINGQLFKGANFNAGEFGYQIVNSINNNDTRLATLSLNGSVGHGIVDKYEERTDTKNLDGEALHTLAKSGEAVAVKVIDDFYYSLAKGIFNLTTAFDPEIVLIGGAISKDKDFIIRLQKEIDDLQKGHRDMGAVKVARIKACHFLNDAGIIGAVYHALTKHN